MVTFINKSSHLLMKMEHVKYLSSSEKTQQLLDMQLHLLCFESLNESLGINTYRKL